MAFIVGQKFRVKQEYMHAFYRGKEYIIESVQNNYEGDPNMVRTHGEATEDGRVVGLAFYMCDIEPTEQQPTEQQSIVVGARVRFTANAPFCVHNYDGHTGTVGRVRTSDTVYVDVDSCGKCNTIIIYTMIKDLELLNTTLPDGFKMCRCGTITSRSDGKCCDCMQEKK